MKFYESGEYRATAKWPYHISAGCIVFRKNAGSDEVLLLIRNPGSYPGAALNDVASYHLPKGTVSINESIKAAAERETEEEAGCDVQVLGYLGSIDGEREFVLRGITTNKVTHYFAAVWKADSSEIDNEHDDKVWMSLNEAEKQLAKPNPKGEDEIVRRLKKFLEVSGEL